MTNQEILEKAIQKAVAGGWTSPLVNENEKALTIAYQYFADRFGGGIIYNHEFAKALWPPAHEAKCPYCSIAMFSGLRHPIPCPFSQMVIGDTQLWKYHLQQMVIAEDPIKYLGEHL